MDNIDTYPDDFEKCLQCSCCGQILRDTNDIAYQTFETNEPGAAVVDSLCNNCYEIAWENAPH